MPLDSYTRNLERRVRLLLKEQARLVAENRRLRDEMLDLAGRLRRHVPYERGNGSHHTADTLELIAAALVG